ncbi:hypothetical protein EST38_g1021 [Candolleomyces aberdarensis]|uniref:Nephrocystin 3-like N-terminal domain-containing protein n=1 Tax=Candolleomyces aberdarensis TaxID=2316362 RepID=A0A4V1Q5A0_9AGAR|nr:hypothetical protein EST38_g1021 [Candolleomyces aberdarensis]
MSGKPVEYLVDSRKPDVEKSWVWILSSTGLVLCLYGPAGIGKSTLAGHLSEELRSVGRLAASIFLGDFPTDTSGPETIIKMLAHELGSIHPRAIPKIVEAMYRCHGTSLKTHIEAYIFEPLRALGHPHPLIIILDAIDEWRDHPTFIKALAPLNSKSAVVKFIITSRLNPHTSRLPGVDKVSVRTHPLLPVSTKVMKGYFEKHLEAVAWVDGRKANAGDVIKLAELSAGLPVWASTVISMLSQQFSESPPHEILAGILASRRHVGGSKGLVELYSDVLSRLFPSPDVQTYFRKYFGITLVLQEPLPLSDFSTLTGMPAHLISKIQLSLSALQTRSPPVGSERMVHPATTLFHLSFLEYVQAKTTENLFAISPFESHSVLGLACLAQITSLLSMSPYQDPSLTLRDVQWYAVKYWPLHVSRGTHRSGVEWSQTPHCSTLQIISTDARQWWATLFLKALSPERHRSRGELQVHRDLKTMEGKMTSILNWLACRLGKAEGDQWDFQVACLEVAVRLDGGSGGIWYKLGWLFDKKGKVTGSLKMHEESVLAFRRALELQQNPQAGLLGMLGAALFSCYMQHGNTTVLTEAILYQRKALALRPAPHPDRHTSLLHLAISLSELHGHHDDINALKECISLLRETLALRPAPHPHRHTLLISLGFELQGLYERSGDISTLNEGISHLREALALQAAPDSRYTSPNNFGITLNALFHEADDGVKALNEAISHLRKALDLQPPSRPARPATLHNLGIALYRLSSCNGSTDTLNEAISHLREVLAIWPAPHPRRSDSLDALGRAQRLIYERNGSIDALNESISLFRETLALRPAPHTYRASTSRNLSNSLRLQFEQNGEIGVLNEAIIFCRESLALHPPGHRCQSESAKLLVSLLKKRFEVTGDERDREEVKFLDEHESRMKHSE